MIITVTLNPAVDKTVEINDFEVGKVNRVAAVREDAGGKGINVSKVIKSLGGESKAIGLLGGRTGSFVKAYLDGLSIKNEFVFVEGETRTNLKVVDPIRKTNTDINEPGPSITHDDIQRVEQILMGNLDRDSVVILSGSVPKNTDSDVYGKWIRMAKALGAKTILDADRDLLKNGIKEGPYLIKPNIHELEQLFDIRIDGIDQTERLGRSLLNDYGIEIAVVSLGRLGALFINKNCSLFAHSPQVEVKSTVGAGDSMVAALAYAISKGYSFEKALTLSMASGTANVMTSGSQAADYGIIAELENIIQFEEIKIR